MQLLFQGREYMRSVFRQIYRPSSAAGPGTPDEEQLRSKLLMEPQEHGHDEGSLTQEEQSTKFKEQSAAIKAQPAELKQWPVELNLKGRPEELKEPPTEIKEHKKLEPVEADLGLSTPPVYPPRPARPISPPLRRMPPQFVPVPPTTIHPESLMCTTTEVYFGERIVASGTRDGGETNFLVCHQSNLRLKENRTDLFVLSQFRSKPLAFTDWPASLLAAAKSSELDLHILPPLPRPSERVLPSAELAKLLGPPGSKSLNPCRKIIFTIRSRDQGQSRNYADHGTYNGSYTWFSAGIERWGTGLTTPTQRQRRFQQQQQQQPANILSQLGTLSPEVAAQPRSRGSSSNSSRGGLYRFNHPLHASEDLLIQKNLTASKGKMIEHRVEWSHDDDTHPNSPEAEMLLRGRGRGKATGNGEFVRDLMVGDVVTVWAAARNPGWTNWVESVKIEVYWAP